MPLVTSTKMLKDAQKGNYAVGAFNAENMEMVKQILEEAGYEGRTLVSGAGDFRSVCEAIQYTPTTVVVDQNGDMIGDVLIGGQEDLEKVYTEMVNNALESMGKAGIGDGTN